jgi:hypothetical protein
MEPDPHSARKSPDPDHSLFSRKAWHLISINKKFLIPVWTKIKNPTDSKHQLITTKNYLGDVHPFVDVDCHFSFFFPTENSQRLFL